ncbi:MAG: c-type cytochrome [Longimicrobiales bacterium]
MTLNRTNIVLALLLVFVAILTAVVRVDHSQPNYQITLGDDMTYSPSYSAYDTNDNFLDGRTMQTPVPYTIARGSLPIYFEDTPETTPEDALRALEELTSPLDPESDEYQQAILRGSTAFQIYCTACHGGGGAGDGPVAKRGFAPPPSLLTGNSLKMKDGQLFHILNYGQASMPPFAGQLSPARSWDIIAYIRDLQAKNPPETTEPAPAADSDAEPTNTKPDAAEVEATDATPSDAEVETPETKTEDSTPETTDTTPAQPEPESAAPKPESPEPETTDAKTASPETTSSKDDSTSSKSPEPPATSSSTEGNSQASVDKSSRCTGNPLRGAPRSDANLHPRGRPLQLSTESNPVRK